MEPYTHTVKTRPSLAFFVFTHDQDQAVYLSICIKSYTPYIYMHVHYDIFTGIKKTSWYDFSLCFDTFKLKDWGMLLYETEINSRLYQWGEKIRTGRKQRYSLRSQNVQTPSNPPRTNYFTKCTFAARGKESPWQGTGIAPMTNNSTIHIFSWRPIIAKKILFLSIHIITEG